MDTQNSFLDIQKSVDYWISIVRFLDIQYLNNGNPKIHPDFWISINQFLDIQKAVEYWISIIGFMDIQT